MQRNFSTINIFLTLLLPALFFNVSEAQEHSDTGNHRTDILIVGGGASGVSATI